MGRLRKWLSNLTKRPCKIPIPPLPDDLLLTIFEYYTPKERLPLRLVCKRFCNLEMQIGNRTLDGPGVVMNAENVGLVPQVYSILTFEAQSDGDFESTTPGISKYFKGATSEFLNIHVAENRVENPSRALLSLLNLIAYERLYLYLYCKSDFADFIMSYFDHFKNDHLIEISFIWHTLKGQNLSLLQEAMKELPKVKSLCVFEDTKIQPEQGSFLLNGSLMLAMLGTARYTLLYSIDCTAQDLLDAFDIVCESNNFHEVVKLYVVHSAIDDLLALADEKGFLVAAACCILDYGHGYAMSIHHDKRDASGRCTMVLIHRISAEEMAKARSILLPLTGADAVWHCQNYLKMMKSNFARH